MKKTASPRIRFVEVAKDVYAALTPVRPLDLTDAGLMNNFSNSAYIARGDGLVCDTFFDLAHARELQTFCLQTGGRSPGLVVNTHGHWDHYWGNQVFAQARILGHRDLLQDCAGDKAKLRAFKLLNGSRAAQAAVSGLEGRQLKRYLPQGQSFRFIVQATGRDFDLRGVVPTPPSELFTQDTTLDLDGMQVQLLHLGAIHSSSDTVVWLPAERVLFAGDVFADCSAPTSLAAGKRWLAAMDRILDQLQPEVIVPGHGVVYDRARAENQREYFRALLSQFEQYYTDTISPDELCDRIDVQQYIDHRPRLGWVLAVQAMAGDLRKKKR